jgi:hypothetical protein
MYTENILFLYLFGRTYASEPLLILRTPGKLLFFSGDIVSLNKISLFNRRESLVLISIVDGLVNT